jgi:hypothetical protein
VERHHGELESDARDYECQTRAEQEIVSVSAGNCLPHAAELHGAYIGVDQRDQELINLAVTSQTSFAAVEFLRHKPRAHSPFSAN